MEKVTPEMLAISLYAAGRPESEIALALQRDGGWVRAVLQAAGVKEGGDNPRAAMQAGLTPTRWGTEALLTEAYCALLRLPEYLDSFPEEKRRVEDLLDRIACNRGFVSVRTLIEERENDARPVTEKRWEIVPRRWKHG